jgi:type IV pilus assembly protein PilB
MEAKQELGGKMLLGEILLERGLITKPQLDQALRVQVGGMRRLGSILVRMKLLTGDDLTKALSARLKLPIVKIEDEYRDNAKTVLPRYLCRKYSVLPLSLEGGNVVRHAMADPYPPFGKGGR